MRPEATIAACRSSHQRLLRALEPLTDEDMLASSELPRWTRAHVVAHLINKADAHTRIFGGPAAGEVRTLYPAGHDQDAAAESGASREADALRSDLDRAWQALESAWDMLDDDLWGCDGVMTAGPRSMIEIVRHHLRNVEVHHVDLNVGYRPTDWPDAFVEGELERRVRGLPDRVDHAALLAWLLGRAPAPDLGPW